MTRTLPVLLLALAACAWLAPAPDATAQDGGLPASVTPEADRLFAAGDFHGALAEWERYLADNPPETSPSARPVLRRAAWAAAQAGEAGRALRFLWQAVRCGWRNPRELQADPHFAHLRGHPLFLALMHMLENASDRELSQIDIDSLGGMAVDPLPPVPTGPRFYLGEHFEGGERMRMRVEGTTTINVNFRGQRGTQITSNLVDVEDTITAVDEMGMPARRERVFLRSRATVQQGPNSRDNRGEHELVVVTSSLDADHHWVMEGEPTINPQVQIQFEELYASPLMFPLREVAIGESWTIGKKPLSLMLVAQAPQTVLNARRTCTLESVGEWNGRPNVAVIATEESARMRQPQQPMLIDRELRGRVWFDLDLGHPLRSESSGTIRITTNQGNRQTVVGEGDVQETVEYDWGHTSTHEPIAAVAGWFGAALRADAGTEGLTITTIYRNSPAHLAGLQTGDRVIEANGEATTAAGAINELLRDVRVGDDVKLTVRRDGAPLEVTATITDRPETRPEPLENPDGPDEDPDAIPDGEQVLGNLRLGMRLREQNDPDGLEVRRVEPGSIAEAAGLQVGDVVLRFNGVRTDSDQAFRDALANTRIGSRVRVVVQRDGQRQRLEMNCSR